MMDDVVVASILWMLMMTLKRLGVIRGFVWLEGIRGRAFFGPTRAPSVLASRLRSRWLALRDPGAALGRIQSLGLVKSFKDFFRKESLISGFCSDVFRRSEQKSTIKQEQEALVGKCQFSSSARLSSLG